MAKNSHSCFSAKIDLIGINPFVFLPEKVLLYLFKRAGKNTSPLPVCGTVNGKKYNSAMTSQGLNDQQVADVLSYVYSSWGNNNTKVTPAMVKAQRGKK